MTKCYVRCAACDESHLPSRRSCRLPSNDTTANRARLRVTHTLARKRDHPRYVALFSLTKDARCSTPLNGYRFEPMKMRCSSVCGQPSSSFASVASVRKPCTSGDSHRPIAHVRPLNLLRYFSNAMPFRSNEQINSKLFISFFCVRVNARISIEFVEQRRATRG